MSKPLLQNANQRLMESAFDFLIRAVDEIESRPKYSVIHFSTAIELLLKARLMNEHWSLLVERTSEADLQMFLAGNCKTVSQSEAARRLIKVCNEPLPKDALQQFEKIAAHRNRMIHFFHEAGNGEVESKLTEEIFREQCLGWYYLERLLAQWQEQFADFSGSIWRMRAAMRQNRSFLSIAFERLREKIKEDAQGGATFEVCSGCGYESAEGKALSNLIFERECRICALSETYFETDCPAGCGAKVRVLADFASERACSTCGVQISDHQLEDLLDTSTSDPTDYSKMNCALCSGSGTVVEHFDKYICSHCLAIESEASFCAWCNELQIGGGDLENSYRTGCEFCDGHAGWTRDD